MKAEDVIQFYTKLKTDKEPFDVLYQDVADFFCPYSGDFNRLFGKAENRQRYLINQDAQHALDVSASSLLGLLANPASRWFYLELQDEDLNRDAKIAEYLDKNSQTLLNYFNNPDSMFYAHLKTALIEALAYGTPTMMSRFNGDAGAFEFKALPLCNVVVAEDTSGMVDVVIYKQSMTYRQIAQKQSKWNIHKDTLKAAEEKPFERTDILYAYMPREGGDESAKAKDKLPYAEYIIDEKQGHMMFEDGYYEKPVNTARWMKVPSEVYGRGPAMIALSDARTLNEAIRLFYDAAEKNANPAVFLPDDGRMGNKINFTANAVNFYDATKGRIEFLTGTADINVILTAIQGLQENIRKLLYVDQLQLQGTAQMTATEVMQRVDEKARLLAPSLGRLQSELISPIVLRCFNILIREGLVDPLPPALAGRNIKVVYSNQVQRSQRAPEIQNLLTMVQYGMEISQIDPTVMDRFDLDKAVIEGMDMLNVTAMLARDEDEVEEMREARQQQQEAAQQLALAQQGGDALQSVGKGVNAIQGELPAT